MAARATLRRVRWMPPGRSTRPLPATRRPVVDSPSFHVTRSGSPMPTPPSVERLPPPSRRAASGASTRSSRRPSSPSSDVDLDVAPGRVLRPARAQRRRQDDAHQDPHDAAPAERGHGPDLRLRRRRGREADPPDHEHGRRRRAVGLRDPDRPRAALDVQPVLRPAAQGRLAPRRRADRRGRHGRRARAAGQHPVAPASARR